MIRRTWKLIAVLAAGGLLALGAGVRHETPAGAQESLDARASLDELLQEDGMTQEQMAVLLLRTLEDAQFVPPDCVPGQERFDDVPASNQFCPFIEELARRGIAMGCDSDNFCPGDPVSRAQMAVFVVRTLLAEPEPFHIVGEAGEPPFENGWVNVEEDSGEAGFYKDFQGVVHLKGAITAGSNGNDAFTLPEGYRPADWLFLPAAGRGPVAANLEIFASGSVVPTCDATPCSIGMDGLAFRVEVGDAASSTSGKSSMDRER